MTYRKKLIEVTLPLDAINEASASEKAVPRHGHPQTLHLWWARRPLAAARAVIFASLIDDPANGDAPVDFVQACQRLPKGKHAANHDTPRMRLFDFIERLVQWENSTDSQLLGQARDLIRLSSGGELPTILDPFAGGGTIPLEAARLDLKSFAADLNPVAVLINRALIEIPSRFMGRAPINPNEQHRLGSNDGWVGATGIAKDIEYYGELVRKKAWERIGEYYPAGPNGETVLAWLWARTVRCPNPICSAIIPLTRSFWISKRKGKTVWIEPLVNTEERAVRFQIRKGAGLPPDGTVRQRSARCIVCGESVPLEYVRSEGANQRIGKQLMGMFAEGNGERSYLPPSHEQTVVDRLATPPWEPETSLPEHALGFRVQRYGITHHRDLFTTRQLTDVSTFAQVIKEMHDEICRDAIDAGLPNDEMGLQNSGSGARAYAEAITVYLSCALSRLASYNNANCVWNIEGGSIAQIFTRQTISMAWDFIETNPFQEMSGNWMGGVGWVSDVVKNLAIETGGKVVQHDASVPFSSHFHGQSVVITDPPYYDNIGYADLSDFFYVWLRHTLGDIYPHLFSTVLTPKSEELIADPDRHGGSDEAKRYFETGLIKTFHNIRHIQNLDYPVAVYYAFKQTESETRSDKQELATVSSTGWETILTGLITAGFMINGTWPIRTERQSRMRSIASNALASSIVLVCRPRPIDAPPTTRREFLTNLKRELPSALKALQQANIAPVDLAQATIGPGIAIFSRYIRVMEADGSPMRVRTALQLINQALDEVLAEQEGEFDADTRWALAWFEQVGTGEGAYGVAETLSKAKNTSVAGLADAGLLAAKAGRVRLLRRDELPDNWDPSTDPRLTVWETTQHLIRALEQEGEYGAATLLAKLGEQGEIARDLAYRLYTVCERKKWADEALAYNSLVIAWPQIMQLASQQAADTPRQQEMFT